MKMSFIISRLGHKVIKLFSMLNAADHKIYPAPKYQNAIVGILKFISMTNTTSDSLKARKVSIFSILSLRDVEISCSIELSMRKVL